jgi:alkylation response protein AidB-like acyl-CoA dehydrogenase
MTFLLPTSEQAALRDSTVRFIRDTMPMTAVRRHADDSRADHGQPTDLADYTRRAGPLGWFAPFVAEDYGGGSVSGHAIVEAALIAEQRGRYVQPGGFSSTTVVAASVQRAGHQEQREELLPQLASGSVTATWAVSPPGGAWTTAVESKAARAGDRIVIDGAYGYVESAAGADVALVVTLLDGELAHLLVPMATPGISVNPLRTLDLAGDMSELVLREVTVDPSALLAVGAGDSGRLLEEQLQLATVLVLCDSLGAMTRLLEISVEYAKTRVAFGRPIGSFQAVKHMLADASMLVNGSRAVVSAAVEAVDDGRGDAAEIVSIAKAFVSDNAPGVAQTCLQVHGGIGYAWEHDLHFFMRRMAADSAMFGSSRFHRARVCALQGL